MSERLYLFNRIDEDYSIHVHDGNTSVAILIIPEEFVQKKECTTINTDFWTLKEDLAYIDFPLKDTVIDKLDDFTYKLKSVKGINTFYFAIEGYEESKITTILPKPVISLDSMLVGEHPIKLISKFFSVSADKVTIFWERIYLSLITYSKTELDINGTESHYVLHGEKDWLEYQSYIKKKGE